jgi:integrase
MAGVSKQSYRDKKTGELRYTGTYRIDYRDALGFRRTHPGGTDYKSACQLAADLERDAARGKVGGVNPFKESLAKPLSEHLADLERYHVMRGTSARHLQQVISHCKSVFTAIKAHSFGDVTVAKIEGHFADLADEGLGPRTRNAYRAHLRSFFSWGKRTKRFPDHPLQDFEAVNEAADKRRERRALTIDEMDRLLLSSLERPTRELVEKDPSPAGEQLDAAGRLGRERALTYRLLYESAARAGELRRVRWCDVDLSGDEDMPGALVIKARVSKAKVRDETIPIRPALKRDLIAWRAENPEAAATDPVVNIPVKPMPIFKKDLAAAKPPIPYCLDGRYADMHALRHATASHLAASGVPAKAAQTFMRHSDISLTLGVYVSDSFLSRNIALDALPSLGSIYGQGKVVP